VPTQAANINEDSFPSSPLITPKDLEADPRIASRRTPPGVLHAWPTPDGPTSDASPLPGEYDTTVWAVEGSDPTAFILDSTFAAILSEATRFGGSLRTHSNRSKGDPTASQFLRFLPADSDPSTGSFTVARIVVDAEAREVVHSHENRRDLRRSGLSPNGRKGKAQRNSREDLMNHAKQSAAKYVQAYLAQPQCPIRGLRSSVGQYRRRWPQR
jgi:hypothetical protein